MSAEFYNWAEDPSVAPEPDVQADIHVTIAGLRDMFPRQWSIR